MTAGAQVPDERAAVECYAKAAEKGHAMAMLAMAMAALHGKGMPKDEQAGMGMASLVRESFVG